MWGWFRNPKPPDQQPDETVGAYCTRLQQWTKDNDLSQYQRHIINDYIIYLATWLIDTQKGMTRGTDTAPPTE